MLGLYPEMNSFLTSCEREFRGLKEKKIFFNSKRNYRILKLYPNIQDLCEENYNFFTASHN